ncbi:MAG TPA: hypothetical protein VGN26_08445, partial [Armatimonadota bacterium]
ARALVDLTRTLPGHLPVYLLPCHDLGQSKRARLGLGESGTPLAAPAPDTLERIAESLKDVGLEVRVGGS